MAEKKELEIPAGFPDNANPSQENIKAFNDQRDADQKAMDEGNAPDFTEERVGEGIREIPVDEREPEASPAGKSQTKTVSK